MGARFGRFTRFHSLTLSLALGVFALVTSIAPLSASAQGRDVILWLPTVAPEADVEVALLETTLNEILVNASDARHVVGRSGLQRALENGEFTLPPCFAGAEPCMSAEHAVLQTLGVDLVVRVLAHDEGERLDVTVLDGSLAPRSSQVIEEADLRLAAFAAVAGATGATARLTVSSQPVQATIHIDGEPVSATPWQSTLPVGMYRVTLIAEGYFDHTTNLELRAGESRALDVDLARRYALLTLTSGTPGAQLFIDNDPTPWPVNAPVTLEPGSYILTVRSPDYSEQQRQVELVAGEDRSVSMNLLLSPETIRRRERDRILGTPLMLQFGLHLDATSLSLDGAHGDAFDTETTLLCAAEPDAGDGDPCAANSGVFAPAIEGDIVYAWRFLELGIGGFGYRIFPVSKDGRTFVSRNGTRFIDIDQGRAFIYRMPSVGVRWLFGPAFEPFFRTGPILEFERYRGIESGNALAPDEVTLRRNSVWWEARAGARIHMNRLVYAWLDGHIAGNIGHSDGARGGGTLGIGINLGDPFGIDDALNRRFPARTTRRDRTEEPSVPQPTNSLPEQL